MRAPTRFKERRGRKIGDLQRLKLTRSLEPRAGPILSGLPPAPLCPLRDLARHIRVPAAFTARRASSRPLARVWTPMKAPSRFQFHLNAFWAGLRRQARLASPPTCQPAPCQREPRTDSTRRRSRKTRQAERGLQCRFPPDRAHRLSAQEAPPPGAVFKQIARLAPLESTKNLIATPGRGYPQLADGSWSCSAASWGAMGWDGYWRGGGGGRNPKFPHWDTFGETRTGRQRGVTPSTTGGGDAGQLRRCRRAWRGHGTPNSLTGRSAWGSPELRLRLALLRAIPSLGWGTPPHHHPVAVPDSTVGFFLRHSWPEGVSAGDDGCQERGPRLWKRAYAERVGPRSSLSFARHPVRRRRSLLPLKFCLPPQE